jgi:uncharacterized protein
MTEVNGHEPGAFCWVDLATNDLDAAKGFYTQVLGWEAQDTPIPGGVYSWFRLHGRDAAAAGDQQEQERSQGVPPHWNSYISSEDVDAVAKLAEEAGGTLLAPPFDVMELGRMTAIADPGGAVVCAWQANTHIGAGVAAEPGTISWNELLTANTGGAAAFYGQVFGWEAEEAQMPTGPYTVFMNNGKPAAGLLSPPAEAGEVPPHWLVYFNVADAPATADKVIELGGRVHTAPTDIPTVGLVGVFADPQGASFGLIQPTP